MNIIIKRKPAQLCFNLLLFFGTPEGTQYAKLPVRFL